MPDDCLGDLRVGGAKMDLWLESNSIAYESTPIFAVYETLNGKYDSNNIQMELYKRLKMTKTDNADIVNYYKIKHKEGV